MGSLVRAFKRDGYAHFFLLLILVGVLILLTGIVSRGSGGDDDDDDGGGVGFLNVIHVPFIFVSILLFFSVSSSMRRHNMQVDARIQELCRRYSDAAVTLQYATEFTQVCKPKGAQTYRALYISPGGVGAGMAGAAVVGVAIPQPEPQMQTVQVTCPEGRREGDTIIVQGSGGQMQVVVPPGVSAGMVFMVQMPAVPVVEAVAVPIGA